MTDETEDPLKAWHAASKLRSAFRELPGPASLDEPTDRDDDTGEIISSLKHEKLEQLGPPDGSLVRTVAEVRGIRQSIDRIYKDPVETAMQRHVLSWTPADTYDVLFLAANRHLRAKGRMDFFAVVETADDIAHSQGTNVSETTTRHFQLWRDQTRTDTGALSIETAAANFIQSSDRLFMLLNKNPEMQAAAFAYADAWHWLHLELMGEHELAAKGANSERGLRAGPEAKRSQAALRSAIIAVAYKKFAANEQNEQNRNSTKYAAEAIRDEVNAALQDKGLDAIALGTIKNQLPAIIKMINQK